MSDQEDLDQFDDLDGDDVGGDTGSAEGAPPDGGDAGANDSKRVNDLMSKWQKSEARARKLEERLAKLEGPVAGGGDSGAKPDPEREAWIEAQREFLRERAFNSDPRLAEYGLTQESITGNTPAEIKASVKRHVDLIAAVEAKARNKVLAEHGLTPEVAGGSGSEPLDIAGMDDKEFDKLVQRAKSGY